ncbi:GNAT family N-acetyltransferase [Lysinibacillus xylanilyticus]|uniref:GNAT family N-acetyltransferase n=1 Tax=Lysinibacillus xylanilyticus TaxID=582475 RepID=UPI0037F895FC
MERIILRRPQPTDTEELHTFFLLVIADTYAKEGLAELYDEQKNEWEIKKHYLKLDCDSQGEERFFWLAIHAETKKIVGTIEYGIANELIQKNVQEDLTDFPEIGTVFVHPSYQNRGIGTMLLQQMLTTLESKHIRGFCLDSGYKKAQLIWQKKFGKPDFLLEHYWGENSHHMIWKQTFPNIKEEE